MNKAKLKAYAPAARRAFIQAVTERANLLGLSEAGNESAALVGEVTIIGGRAFPKEICAQRHRLEARIRREGFTPTMEEVAYTWFNRFTALRFMELHGYLSHGFRVLSHPAGGVVPEILEQALNVELPGLNRHRVVELKLEATKDAELYRLLLVAQCNALHRALPFLFEAIDDDTELLLPANLLHSDSVIRRLVEGVDEADWDQVEIIGWLYQFYISERKDEVIGRVVKSEDIPAATQLFTPNWIVKYMVQNSLGRQWLQTYPHSFLRGKMIYYIEPAAQTAEVEAQLKQMTPEVIDPEAITVLDPACGSGHILVEAYDVLKEIYQERGYRQRDIARLILEKNLYGLDIDERAAQLAGFALLMKARRDDRRILEDAPRLNVLAIEESAGERPAEELAGALLRVRSQPRGVLIVGEDNLWGDMSRQGSLMVAAAAVEEVAGAAAGVSREEIVDLLQLFREGKTLGSLISVPDDLAQRLPAIRGIVEENLNSGELYAREAANTLLPFVRQAEVLAGKYDCVIANPPYMGGKFYNAGLKNFVNKNYAEGKADLYGCFVMRNAELCIQGGRVAMLTIPNWMFLSSFEPLREIMLDDLHIETLVHNGRGVFGSDFGSCTFTLAKEQKPNVKGAFKRLFDVQGSVASNEELRKRFFEKGVFRASSYDFKKIPGSPIAYWVSDKVREIFEKGTPLGDVTNPQTGLQTSDNLRFLKFWHEVNQSLVGYNCRNNLEAKQSGKKWFPQNKGGEFRKWYGNREYLVNWLNDGEEIKTFVSERYPYLNGNIDYVVKDRGYFFKEGVSWSHTSISFFSARLTPAGSIFNVEAPTLFTDNIYYFIGLLVSKVASAFMNLLNPTLHFLVGSVRRLPVPTNYELIRDLVEKVVEEAVAIARADWDSFETSWDFQELPLLRSDLKASTVEESFNNWQARCNANIQRMQELETENNRLFIEAYNLQDELTPEVPLDQITLARADAERDTRRLISYAVGCMLGRYSLDTPGLVYAGAGNTDFDLNAYSTFPADPDGILPLTDHAWFDDDAASRFAHFIRCAWQDGCATETQRHRGLQTREDEEEGRAEARDKPESASSVHSLPANSPCLRVSVANPSEGNLAWIAAQLSPKAGELPRDTIRRYFSTAFYKDHLQTYKRRPIYWLFSSGKERAFQCLVYLHRYNHQTLARMRTAYVTPLFGKLSAQIDHLDGPSDKEGLRRGGEIDAATSTAQRTKLRKQLETLERKQAELSRFDELLRNFIDQRITLDLDDGVRVNYGKFGNLLAESRTIAAESEAS